MKPISKNSQCEGGYSFRPFFYSTTSLVPDFSRPNDGVQRVPFNISAVYTPYFQETLVNGVLQGRKQFDERGASLLSRKRMWEAVRGVFALIGGMEGLESVIGEAQTYLSLKESELLRCRADFKAEVTAEALKGWIRNDADDFRCCM